MAREKGKKELLQAWFYDEVTLVAGTAYTTQALFAVSRGAGVPPKTNTQTNLTGPGGYFTGIKSLTIKSMVLIPESLIPVIDMNGVLNGNGILTIEDKPYPQPFNLKLVAGGTQLREFSRATPLPVPVASVGDGRIDNVLSFTRPYLITISSDEVFSLTLNWDAPGFIPTVNIRLLFVFFGRYTRSVL